MDFSVLILLIARLCCAAAIDVTRDFKEESSMEQPLRWGWRTWPAWGQPATRTDDQLHLKFAPPHKTLPTTSPTASPSASPTASPTTSPTDPTVTEPPPVETSGVSPTDTPLPSYVDQALKITLQMQEDIVKMRTSLNITMKENSRLSEMKKRLETQLVDDRAENQQHVDRINSSLAELNGKIDAVSQDIDALRENKSDHLKALTAERDKLKSENAQMNDYLSGEQTDLSTKQNTLYGEISSLKFAHHESAMALAEDKQKINGLRNKINIMNRQLEPLAATLNINQKKHDQLIEQKQQMETYYRSEAEKQEEAHKHLQEQHREFDQIDAKSAAIYAKLTAKQTQMKKQEEALEQLDGEVALERLASLRLKHAYEIAASTEKSNADRKQQTDTEYKKVLPQIQSLQRSVEEAKGLLNGDRQELSNLQQGEAPLKNQAVSAVQETAAEIMDIYGGVLEKFKVHKPNAFRASNLVNA